jgi:hypothetical protein
MSFIKRLGHRIPLGEWRDIRGGTLGWCSACERGFMFKRIPVEQFILFECTDSYNHGASAAIAYWSSKLHSFQKGYYKIFKIGDPVDFVSATHTKFMCSRLRVMM